MPEKSTDLNNISISVVSVLGLIYLFISGYVALLIKNLTKDFRAGDEKLEARITEAEKDIEHHRNMHEDHYNRIHDLEKVQAVIKAEHDINHGRGKKDD